MRIGRIPYINCYPVYGAIDRGIVQIDAEIVNGVPTALNAMMQAGELDVSVVSAVEYARESSRYLLLPDLAISCDGPVQSVMLFSSRPVGELGGRNVLISRSSMTSAALLDLLFDEVWHCEPRFVPGDAEIGDVSAMSPDVDARLVIGDAALLLRTSETGPHRYAYDLGSVWKEWTGLPFVFAVWVAQRSVPVTEALAAHASLLRSREWGLNNIPVLAEQAESATGIRRELCETYLSGLDYGLSYAHFAGLAEFFRRLVERGRIPNGTLSFLPAA